MKTGDSSFFIGKTRCYFYKYKTEIKYGVFKFGATVFYRFWKWEFATYKSKP